MRVCRYEDGDEEDMDADEIRQYYVTDTVVEEEEDSTSAGVTSDGGFSRGASSTSGSCASGGEKADMALDEQEVCVCVSAGGWANVCVCV